MEKADHTGNIRDLRAALNDEVLDYRDDNPNFDFAADACVSHCTHASKCHYCEMVPTSVFDAWLELQQAMQAEHVSALALIEDFGDL